MTTTPTSWPVQDAKARFSELLDRCLVDGPQTISLRGVPQAVIVSIDLWQQATTRRPTLKDLLLDDSRRFDLDLPQRGIWRHREIED